MFHILTFITLTTCAFSLHDVVQSYKITFNFRVFFNIFLIYHNFSYILYCLFMHECFSYQSENMLSVFTRIPDFWNLYFLFFYFFVFFLYRVDHMFGNGVFCWLWVSWWTEGKIFNESHIPKLQNDTIFVMVLWATLVLGDTYLSQQENTQFAVGHFLWKLAWCESFDKFYIFLPYFAKKQHFVAI